MHKPITIISERNRVFRQRVEVDGLEALYSDVPPVVGGDGSAPTPMITSISRWVPVKRLPCKCTQSVSSGL